MRPPLHRSTSPGFSLVELMIGLALGLFVVAVATALLASQLRENRALMLEARLMQDLRTAADLMTRDLRRAGFWGQASGGVWTAASALGPSANPYAVPPAAAASDAVDLRYSRDAVENGTVDANEQFGYRLRAGTLELQLGLGNWQALTDPASLTVTDVRIVPTNQEVSLDSSCALACVAGDALCPPRLQVRSFAVRLTGRSPLDPRVVRSLHSEVRLRNDVLTGHCAAA